MPWAFTKIPPFSSIATHKTKTDGINKTKKRIERQINEKSLFFLTTKGTVTDHSIPRSIPKEEAGRPDLVFGQCDCRDQASRKTLKLPDDPINNSFDQIKLAQIIAGKINGENVDEQKL